jgi:hypothetical protein
MSDEQWWRWRQQLAVRQRTLAEKFRADLAQLRNELAQAERDGRHTAAQGLRNKIVYRERILARQDGDGT